jgi:glycosyltransferase involved in cell wall biosynthesis
LSRIPIGAQHHLARDVRAAISVAHLSRRFDLIHGHGMRAAWISYLASRRSGKPFVFTAHNLAPAMTGRLAPRLIRATVRAASARIAVSHAVVESFTPLGVDPADCTVIPNGVDLKAFDAPPTRGSVMRSLHLPDDAVLVAAVGRLAPEKGFDRLIGAAHKLLNECPKCRFVLAGEGPEHASLEELAKPLGDRFHLLGRYEAVYGLISAADIVVIPSVEEGQGIVALEAMAAGKPVAAARVGGLIETVVHGETGILVQDGAEDGLAEAIKSLAGDAALRQRMGAAGHKRAKELYSLEGMVSKTLAVYSAVCSGGQIDV